MPQAEVLQFPILVLVQLIQLQAPQALLLLLPLEVHHLLVEHRAKLDQEQEQAKDRLILLVILLALILLGLLEVITTDRHHHRDLNMRFIIT